MAILSSNLLQRAAHDPHDLYFFTEIDFKSISCPIVRERLSSGIALTDATQAVFALFTVAYSTSLTATRVLSTKSGSGSTFRSPASQTRHSSDEALPVRRTPFCDALVLRWALSICALIYVTYDVRFIARCGSLLHHHAQ